MSTPKRKPAPVARKSSATIPAFYKGPTVPRRAGEEKLGSSKVAVRGKTVDEIVQEKGITPIPDANRSPMRTSRTHRSHRTLNSTILFILLASLFSLYACPAPNTTTTATHTTLYTRLNPFIATPHLVPAWERIICKPTNAYREAVLEPYVVPHVQRRVQAVRGNPLVREYVEPAIVRSLDVAHRLWREKLERPVRHVRTVGTTLHARYIAPRYPVLGARIQWLGDFMRAKLADGRTRVGKVISDHPTYRDLVVRLEPYYRRIEAYVQTTYEALLPRVYQARKNAQPVMARMGGRAVGGGRRGWEVARGSVGPRVSKSLEMGLDQAERVWERVVAQLKDLFATRVHPIIHPHYTQSLQPHISTFRQTIYEPYLAAPLARLRPLLYSLVLTPSYADIRRAVKAGYLDTRAAAAQGVENVREKVEGVEDAVFGAAGHVKEKVRDYRGEAIDKARRAADAAKASAASVVSRGGETASSIVAEVSTSGKAVGGAAAGATVSISSVAADVSASVESAAAQVPMGVKSATSEVAHRASSVGTVASVSGSSVVDHATRSVRSVASSVSAEAGRASASVGSVAGRVEASGKSIVDRATRSVGSVAGEVSGNVKAGASAVGSVAGHASGSVSSFVAQASGSVSSVVSQASGTASSVASQASGSASSVVSQASGTASSVVGQASGSASSVVSQASETISSANVHASESVKSVAGAAQGSASSVASRAASAAQPNASTLDPLDPSATEIGSNPGKTTVPHNPDAEQVAALFAEEGVAHKAREQVVAQDEDVVAKDPTHIKQEAAGALHAYLQTHVPQIAQDRLTALEREATAVTRAFEQLLGGLELSADAKDVGAERVKVKASLKKVRAKLDELVVALEKDLDAGLINAGAQKEVDKLIDAAVASAGRNAPPTLRKSYHDIVQSVLDTLNNVNDAVAQEGRLVLKPYRKDAKDRADQALALLDGKATVILPSETVGQVAQAAAGTIGRAKDQIIADIKQATESGSSVYQSATQGAAHAAGTAASKIGLHEQAEAVLAGLADFRREVNQVVEEVTSSGKSGAAKATQAVKDEL